MTELTQVGLVDNLEAIRESVRHAIADGMSQKDIWDIVNSAVQE